MSLIVVVKFSNEIVYWCFVWVGVLLCMYYYYIRKVYQGAVVPNLLALDTSPSNYTSFAWILFRL